MEKPLKEFPWNQQNDCQTSKKIHDYDQYQNSLNLCNFLRTLDILYISFTFQEISCF